MWEIILMYWPLISFVIVTTAGLGAWLLRMEGRVSRNFEEIQRLEERMDKQRQEDQSNLNHRFDRLEDKLDKLAGVLIENARNVGR